MKRWIQGILDNESSFGRVMSFLWILIASNLMFVVFSLPVVTIGPAIAALFHVMFKMLRGHRDLSPVKEFWNGFRSNFRQGIVLWLLVLAVAFLGYVDIRFSNYAGGVFTWFKYAVYAVLFFALVIAAYTYPVMACFEDTLPHLWRNALFFAAKNPLKMLIIAALDVIPLYFTYLDQRMLPLYGFLWVVFGFALLAWIEARLLLKDFEKFLPKVNEWGFPIDEDAPEE